MQKRHNLACQTLAAEVFLQNHARCAASLQSLRVLSLMIISRQRKRNHDRGFSGSHQFSARRRAGPANNQVGPGKLAHHVVDIAFHVSACLPARGFVPALDFIEFALTGLMRYVQRFFHFCKMRQRLNHRVIYRARSLRATEDQQIKTFRSAWLCGNFKELAAHRITGQNAFAAKVWQRLCKRNRRPIDKARQPRLVQPGRAFESITSVGKPNIAAANKTGPET